MEKFYWKQLLIFHLKFKVEKIFSEVFENEKAYNLYKSYNFKEVENKVINNKIVIGMEKNENRKF